MRDATDGEAIQGQDSEGEVGVLWTDCRPLVSATLDQLVLYLLKGGSGMILVCNEGFFIK